MVVAVTLIQDQGDTFSDCDHLVDGAGNRFVAYGEMGQGPIEGNRTWVTIKRYAPSGAITGEWEVTPTDNHKIDELTLAHSGDVLLVLLTTHEIVSNKPRSIRVESAAIQGVYSVRPGQDEEEGGPNAFQPIGEPGGGEPGMTLDELTQALADQNSELSVALGKIVKNKSRDAIGTEKVLTENNTKDYLYQWQLDRMYEVFNSNVPGFWQWMVERVGRP